MTTQTRQWEVRPISELPDVARPKNRTGFTEALRLLQPNEALFRGWSSEDRVEQQKERARTAWMATRLTKTLSRQYHTRVTTEGVWVWWEPKE